MRIGEKKKIGTSSGNDLAAEYYRRAWEDEQVALLLAEDDYAFYSQAVYFALQAMEKYLRSAIFKLVDQRSRQDIDDNRNHRPDRACEFLINAITDPLTKETVQNSLRKYVLDLENLQYLNSDLRYPRFDDIRRAHWSLSVSKTDFDEIYGRLVWVRQFVQGLNKVDLKTHTEGRAQRVSLQPPLTRPAMRVPPPPMPEEQGVASSNPNDGIGRIRINEFARQLEVPSHYILELLPSLGVVEKKSHSSTIDGTTAEKIRRIVFGESRK